MDLLLKTFATTEDDLWSLAEVLAEQDPDELRGNQVALGHVLDFVSRAIAAGLSDEQEAILEKLAGAADKLKRVLAREDFNVFAEYVSVDDETGEPLKQAAIHRQWAKLCDENDRILIWSHIESGKTTQLSILRTVWELGRDPNLRFVILSNTSDQAQMIVKAIASYIKSNEFVKNVFPDLKEDPDGPWTNTKLQVVRRSKAKDPSVRAVGVHGAIVGARIDRLVIDDILDQENTENEAARKKVEAWVRASALTRLTKRAKVLVVGTAWHPKDLLHMFSRQPRWKWYRFPILDANGVCTWPEAWSEERINNKREELGPAEFARNLLCLARSEEDARFKQVWIDAALDRGDGLQLVQSIDELFPEGLPEGWVTFTGVDLGVKRKKKSDETAFFTFLEDPKGNRRLLNIEAGKYTGPDIVNMIIDHHHRYGSVVVVENVAAQDFILQFAVDASNVPVEPHTTSKKKRDPVLGVEGLAIELSNNKWTIPSAARKVAPQVDAWIMEMLFYSPQTHTGDRLMACYFAREYARKVLGNRAKPRVQFRVVGDSEDGGRPREDARTFGERLLSVPDSEPANDSALVPDIDTTSTVAC